MSLASEYKRQWEWRDWQTVLSALPPVDGQTILDLGCGVGDLTAELVRRGAGRVIGCDLNEELIGEAQSRRLTNAEFHLCDLRNLPALGVSANGIWCSFAAAYFPDLPKALASWQSSLQVGGWIALTEIDDLFGHQPLSDSAKAIFAAYSAQALEAGHYDFHMGRKLAGYLEQSGFTIAKKMKLEDLEFSFTGPARSDVVEGWRERFSRMQLLEEFCGADFERVREEFLACLSHPNHRSDAAVCVCISWNG